MSEQLKEVAKEVISQTNSASSDILKTYLVKALEATGNAIEKSVDMVMEQVPLLVQEVLHWYFAYNLILFIIGIIIVIVIAFANYKFWKWLPADKFPFMIAIFGDALCLLILFSGHIINLQWLKIWIAPRLWLIEYSASLIK